jgi:hypothetical protein
MFDLCGLIFIKPLQVQNDVTCNFYSHYTQGVSRRSGLFNLLAIRLLWCTNLGCAQLWVTSSIDYGHYVPLSHYSMHLFYGMFYCAMITSV